MRFLISVAGMFCLSVGFVEAQQSESKFDIVSIRRNISGGTETGGPQGDRYTATAMSIYRLILTVYELRPDQLLDVPTWVQNDRFDIVAKASGELTSALWRPMIRAMLEDRFGLVFRKERREGDVYALKLARSDSTLGPDLYRVPDDCVNASRDPLERIAAARRPSSGLRPSFLASCVSIDGLAAVIAGRLQTSVINETGLTGRWDYVVAHSSLQPATGSSALARDERPDLLTAIREQLGLRLERRRGLNEVWIVESIHPPTEN